MGKKSSMNNFTKSNYKPEGGCFISGGIRTEVGTISKRAPREMLYGAKKGQTRHLIFTLCKEQSK